MKREAVKRIERMTSEQAAIMLRRRDEWLRVGTSTDPIDQQKAREAVRACYAAAGVEAPRGVFCLESPLACVLSMPIVMAVTGSQLRDQLGGQLGGQLRDQVRDQLMDQLADQLGGQLGDQLGGQLGGQLRDQLWDQLMDQLRDQLGGQLMDQLADQLRDQLGGQLGGQLRDQVRVQLGNQLDFGGQFWSYFAAWASFVARDLGANVNDRKLSAFESMCRECGMWWPKARFAVVSNRPACIHRDDRGRLHREDGPAIAWRDGWGVWAVHGVRVDEQVILRPESQTIEQIDAEENADVRRVRVERYGWDRYVVETGCEIIDAADDLDGIHQALAKTRKGEKLLFCACPSTGRRYPLEVDASCNTVQQAQTYLRAPDVALRGVMSDADIARAANRMPLAQT